MDQAAPWPYLPTLARLALALAIGLFVGIEREYRRKEAGLRTFAFAALLGAVGGLLGERFSLLALGGAPATNVLAALLDIEAMQTRTNKDTPTGKQGQLKPDSPSSLLRSSAIRQGKAGGHQEDRQRDRDQQTAYQSPGQGRI
jgi:hypothetical protein